MLWYICAVNTCQVTELPSRSPSCRILLASERRVLNVCLIARHISFASTCRHRLLFGRKCRSPYSFTVMAWQSLITRFLNVCYGHIILIHFRLGERPRRLDRDRDLERPARRELRRPSHGSPGPEILICGIGAGGEPVVLSRALRHFNTGIRRSP